MIRRRRGKLSLISAVVGRWGHVQDGVGAAKVETCSAGDVALRGREVGVLSELGRRLCGVAVDAVDDGLGSVGEEGADGFPACAGGGGEDGDSDRHF